MIVVAQIGFFNLPHPFGRQSLRDAVIQQIGELLLPNRHDPHGPEQPAGKAVFLELCGSAIVA